MQDNCKAEAFPFPQRIFLDIVTKSRILEEECALAPWRLWEFRNVVWNEGVQLKCTSSPVDPTKACQNEHMVQPQNYVTLHTTLQKASFNLKPTQVSRAGSCRM